MMKPILKLLVLIVGMLPSFLSAADTKAAAETLRGVSVFAFGGIGFAGTTSEGEVAFHTIFASEIAASDFAAILKTGNLQAKCYALVGLKLKNRPAFDARIEEFVSSKAQVQTCGGCIMAKLPMASVAANIQRGNYDKAAVRELPPAR